MNEAEPSLVVKLELLRHEFDHAFSVPPPAANALHLDLLALRVHGERYAIRLPDVRAIARVRKLVRVPTRTPDLLGLATLRTAIVPVFSLASLLGRGPESQEPHWMITCGTHDLIAFGFSEFDGHLRVAAQEVSAAEATGYDHTTQPCVDGLARTEAGLAALVDVSALIATITARRHTVDSQGVDR